MLKSCSLRSTLSPILEAHSRSVAYFTSVKLDRILYYQTSVRPPTMIVWIYMLHLWGSLLLQPISQKYNQTASGFPILSKFLGEAPIPYVRGNTPSTSAAWWRTGLSWIPFPGFEHTFSPRLLSLPKTNVEYTALHHWLIMWITRNVNHIFPIFCPINMIVNIVWVANSLL